MEGVTRVVASQSICALGENRRRDSIWGVCGGEIMIGSPRVSTVQRFLEDVAIQKTFVCVEDLVISHVKNRRVQLGRVEEARFRVRFDMICGCLTC